MIGQSKTRLLGVTVLVAMFAAGGLTGAVLQRTANADNTRPRQPTRGPSLFETLKLTEAQQKQVCSILQDQANQMKPHELAFRKAYEAVDSAKKEHGPVIREIISATKAQMDSVLTPEQRATMDRFRAERQKFFEDRQAKEQQMRKEGQQGGPRRDGDRGGRPSPGNPLGVVCPGLNDGPGHDGGGRGGKPHGMAPWDGDTSAKRRGPGEPMKAPTTEAADVKRES